MMNTVQGLCLMISFRWYNNPDFDNIISSIHRGCEGSERLFTPSAKEWQGQYADLGLLDLF